ncbi:MAG: hypothetical protein HY515_03950 [Candidatus Aenigmarchaeota archaeon]|nr:hypothetical protein [Candidatus Aenigmarchaeota archaeon]
MRIALIGAGKVGLELIRQTATNPMHKYVGITDTSGTVTKYSGFTPDEMMGLVALKSRGGKLKDYDDGGSHVTQRMEDVLGNNVDVVVDVSSHQTYGFLMAALESGINVVGSNKLPYADTRAADFRRLFAKAKEKGKVLDNRTVVSANLGTLVRIQEFVSTAGGVSYIRGGLSGTMGYISWRMDQGASFSQAVNEAISEGYTETDFRIDLKGMDSARKAVIMARTNNVPLEVSAVNVEQFLPPELENVSVEEALKNLAALDKQMKSRVERAKQNGSTLRYVGELDFDKWVFEIGFKEIPLDDPQASTKNSWNKVTMFPRYWNGQPLSVEGPGAGINVTTQGLMAGLYELAS